MQPRFNVEREKQNRLIADSYENDYCLLQFHSQIEIYLVDEGEMEMLVNGKFQRLQAGHISVSLSYDAHAYKTPEYSRSSAVFIPPVLCEEFINLTKDKRLKDPFITDGVTYQKIKEYCAALEATEDKPIKRLGYVNLILGMILEATEL